MNYVETRKAVMELDELYKETAESTQFGSRPPANFTALIRERQGERGIEAVAALIDSYSWDGRISQRAKDWSATVPHYKCQPEQYLSMGIHLAHLNQMALFFEAGK